MPQFAPGESKAAISPITVKPAGLSCEAEVFLGPDEATKVVTSGRIPFVSTGASQDVRLPIAMPAAEGTYHVFIDVYAEDYLIAAYQVIEDVTIVALELATADVAVGGYPEVVMLYGATVSILGVGSAITGDYEGHFSPLPGCIIRDVPPGTHDVTVSCPGYESSTGPVTFEPGELRTFYWRLYRPEGADIRLGNLVISPTEVYVGGAVTISVTATNYGTAAGSKTITCTVNGTPSEQTVTLNPGESKVVNFETVPSEARIYQVSVDGLTGSFVAIPIYIPPTTAWGYDLDESGYIETQEALQASNDYFDGLIPQSLAFLVIALWKWNVRHGQMKGDFNDDGVIDESDKAAFDNCYDTSLGDDAYNPIGDFNDDGIIDLEDFIAFGDVYTPPVPTTAWGYDLDGSGYIDDTEVLKAANDYNAGLQTAFIRDMVAALWKWNVRRGQMKGDFNDDGIIDASDKAAFDACYGTSLGDAAYNPIGDFNDDGVIDLEDFVAFGDAYTPAPGWLLPTGHRDPNNKWDYEANAYDGDTDTYAENWTPVETWSGFIELTIVPTSISAVRFYLTSPLTPKIGDVDVYYEGAWHDVWQGDPVSGSGAFVSGWNEREIPAGVKEVTKARFRMYNRSYTKTMRFQLHEFNFWSAG